MAPHVIPERLVAAGPQHPGVPAGDLIGRQGHAAVHGLEKVDACFREICHAAVRGSRFIDGILTRATSQDQQQHREQSAADHLGAVNHEHLAGTILRHGQRRMQKFLCAGAWLGQRPMFRQHLLGMAISLVNEQIIGFPLQQPEPRHIRVKKQVHILRHGARLLLAVEGVGRHQGGEHRWQRITAAASRPQAGPPTRPRCRALAQN